jgi:hypothetical protein
VTLTLRQIPSPNYGGARGVPIWIIVHTAEGALTVDSLGHYFASKASGVSSHVGIDDHEIVQYVPYSGQAWTARSANPIADQAELCAFAAWTRAQWLTHGGMLENTAIWIADRCLARGIPAVKITPADVGAHKPGVIGHIDITNGLHDGTHTDPGPQFPWDVVMARVNAILHPPLEDPLPTPDDLFNAKITASDGKSYAFRDFIVQTNDKAYQAAKQAAALEAQVASLTAAVAAIKSKLGA